MARVGEVHEELVGHILLLHIDDMEVSRRFSDDFLELVFVERIGGPFLHGAIF